MPPKTRPTPATGGVYVNAGPVTLSIPFPPCELAPGQTVELPYVPTHRALRPVADAAAAEPTPPATEPTTTGQEQ